MAGEVNIKLAVVAALLGMGIGVWFTVREGNARAERVAAEVARHAHMRATLDRAAEQRRPQHRQTR